MRKRSYMMIPALLLALCFILTACGDKQTEAESTRDSAPAPNPAYSDGSLPSFSIIMNNTTTSKSYSAACSYATDKENVASAYFFLPGGKYEIEVKPYTEDGSDPAVEATGSYDNDIAADKRKSVRVDYYPDTGEIEVEEQKSERNQ